MCKAVLPVLRTLQQDEKEKETELRKKNKNVMT
jgi:hypothetical protein